MRYTTIIDIREVPAIYRNQNSRLVYLHLVLVSGYHETDRDEVHVSIRALAGQVGLSVAAVRNALHMLEQAGLVSRVGGVLRVAKYVIPDEFAAKAPKNRAQAKQQAIAKEREQKEQQERQERLKQVYQVCEQSTVEELEDWLQRMQAAPEGRNLYHMGVALPNTGQAREWLADTIKKKRRKKS